MSLYNLLHGENVYANLLLAMLGMTKADVPRYRDCYWNGQEICIYTRTGGGNREAYEKENAVLCGKAGYLRDEDDDFDCTYATFFFCVPERFAEIVAIHMDVDITPEQRWETTLARLRDGDKNDPQVKRAMKIVTPIVEAIKKSMA
jgi:hypothetical protein